jgi:hypothetical protein
MNLDVDRRVAGARRRPARPWRRVAWTALAFGVAFLAAGRLAQRDVGVSWDEPVQRRAGVLLYSYFASGGTDDEILRYRNLYLYGGLFDLACEAARHLAPEWGAYDLKHLFVLVLGAGALATTVATAARLGGPRAGVIAGALLFASPRWFGHALFNPKDIPFAAFFLLGVAGVVRLATEARPRRSSWLLFALGAGASLGVRAGGVMLLPLLLAGVWSRSSALAPRDAVRPTWRTWLVAAATILAALALGFLFWPYLHHHFASHLLEALRSEARAPFDANVLYRGRWVSALDLGRDYLPVWLTIATPLPVLCGLALAATVAVAALRRRAWTGTAGVAIVALAAGAPATMAVVLHDTLYDGVRHFLFVIPPLTILAALGWERVVGALRRRPARIAALTVLAALLVEPASWLVRGHPYQYVYFNPLVGGLAKASHRYDAEYWGLSVRRGAELLDRIAAARPGRSQLRVCTNVPQILFDPFLSIPRRVHLIGFGAKKRCDYDFAFARFSGLERVLNPRGEVVDAAILVPGQVPFYVLTKRRPPAPRPDARRARGR